MAGTFSLSDGVDTVTLSGRINIPPNLDTDKGEVINYSLAGNPRIHSLYTKVAHDWTVNAVSSANATLLNGWRDDHQALTYTPDTDTPGTTYSVYLFNTGNPVKWMADTGRTDLYEGTIMVREL